MTSLRRNYKVSNLHMRGNPENDDPLGFVGLSSWIAELVHSMIGHAAFRDVPLARTISDPIPFAPMHPLLNGSTVLVWDM